MSYILDALRRAEADRERERGQVPGLHTQLSSGRQPAPAVSPRRWLPLAGGGLLLLVGIVAGSWLTGGPQEAATQSPQPVPSPVPPAATAPVTAPAVPTALPVASAPVRSPAASVSPYLPPAPPPGAVAIAPAPAPVLAVQPAASPATPPAPVPSAEARIPRLAELPDSTQRELPKLVISGSVYSDDPASRFVMINGEVQREGAKLGADLVLEQIRPRELVLRFKGQRYRQPV
ncbi:MAG TPA: general secretion pathway protein GspB [Roseateles sp.]|uniref:general secretion pathway protein GspB n=1 Tax=Roseateles sp. TaxID=1971397 RepID=UPI002EDB6187